tara:strand:+ start:1354 stop:1644 length:291 start_codon:yes stop_codon:yes gene_type:complete
MSNGQQQLELVMERLEQVRAAYLESARFAADQLYHGGKKKVTINDVRDICPPPPSIDPRTLGAVFRRKEDKWQVVGYERSKRAHMRPISVFTKKEE